MRFFMPTKLYCEKDCVAGHAAELASMGKKALIVTGRSSAKKNGSLDDTAAALEKYGVGYVLFDRVEENPSVETVLEGAAFGRENGTDFVIGVGGGSAIDAAKGMALMLANPDKPWCFMYESTPAEALPVAAVPTTCGTGSEVTGVSVITRHDLKTKVSLKHKIFPCLALCDGKYLMSAPRSLIVNTAVDTLSHLIESAVNVLSDRFSDMSTYQGLKLWAECRPFLEGEALTAEGAEKLMAASSLAGISIAQTGTTIPHSLSYMLTYGEHIPHGPAVGAFEAAYLDCAEDALKERVLEAAGFGSCGELGEFISRLAPIDPDRELLRQSAESVIAKPEKLALCPFGTSPAVIMKIAGL